MSVREYFPKLFGNEQTKKRLGKSMDSHTLPHAFLIGGPDGSGKMTLATELSAALNCTSAPQSLPCPCGICNNCKRIYSGNFPDIKVLSRPKDKATIGVDLIKDLREDMFLSPTESDYKIYIIKDAHTMTPDSQNALLKVLEEPPRGVYIMLLACECDKILTTIKSRTQYIAMNRFSDLELSNLIIKISPDALQMKNFEPDKFSAMILGADGRLGAALSLTDKKLAEKNNEERTEILSFLSATSSKARFHELNAAIMGLPNKRGELIIFLEKVFTAIRDLTALKMSPYSRPIFFSSKNEAEVTGADFTEKRLLLVYDALCEAHELCSKNANVQNILSALTAKLKIGS